MDKRKLPNGTEGHPAGDRISGGYTGSPVPFPAVVQCRNLHAAGNEVAGFLPDLIERPLNAVVNRVQ